MCVRFRDRLPDRTDESVERAMQVAAATSDVVDKLEPAVRAAADAARSAVTGEWRACRCSCTTAHPDDRGVCDGKAVLTRRIASADVGLCAPCAVAQGVAEFPRG